MTPSLPFTMIVLFPPTISMIISPAAVPLTKLCPAQVVKLESFDAAAKPKIIREVKTIVPNLTLIEVRPVTSKFPGQVFNLLLFLLNRQRSLLSHYPKY